MANNGGRRALRVRSTLRPSATSGREVRAVTIGGLSRALLGAAVALLACATAASTGFAIEPAPGTPEWYATRVFEGEIGCLAARRGPRLRVGEHVLVFEFGREPAARSILTVLSGDSLRPIFNRSGFDGVYNDRESWERIGCFWSLGMREDPPALEVARYDHGFSDAEDDKFPFVMAIRGAPRSMLAIGGVGVPVDSVTLARFRARVTSQLPGSFTGARLLSVGRQFRSVSGGHVITDLFIGRPFRGGAAEAAPYDSVQICRFFLAGDRVLTVERFSRVAGEEEHIDTEPPHLTTDEWWLDYDYTIGFISFDEGASWARLEGRAGFEGLTLSVTAMDAKRTELWGSAVYMMH